MSKSSELTDASSEKESSFNCADESPNPLEQTSETTYAEAGKKTAESGSKPAKTVLHHELTKLAIYCLCFYLIVACAIKFSPLYSMVILRPEKRNALYDQVINNKEEFRFENANGDLLNAWFLRAPNSKKVVLVFHGNAGNVTHRLLIAKEFLMKGVSVFLFDYRGYGTSSGTPTVAGLVEDGENAYNYVHDKLGYAPKDIIFYGESIGTAVASRVALNKPYSAILLQSGLTSLPDVAGDGIVMLKLYPEWVFPDPHFDTKNIIAKLHGPMLIMHGEKDRLIPVHHGHELFALAQEPKELVLIPNAGHNDMLSADEKIFSDALTQFLTAEAKSFK